MASGGTGNTIIRAIDAAIAICPLNDMPLRFSEVAWHPVLFGALLVRSRPLLDARFERSRRLGISMALIAEPAVVDTFGHHMVNPIGFAEAVEGSAVCLPLKTKFRDHGLREGVLETTMRPAICGRRRVEARSHKLPGFAMNDVMDRNDASPFTVGNVFGFQSVLVKHAEDIKHVCFGE